MFENSPGDMDDVETYNNNLVKSIESLWNQKLLCDVCLRSNGKDFKAHRIVLAASSPYFLGLFSSEMKDSDDEKVSLDNLDPLIIGFVLEFIYSGKTNICEDNVYGLIVAADYLLLGVLKKQASQYLIDILTPSNCISLKQFSEFYTCKELEAAAEDMILKNYVSLSETQEFLELQFKELVTVVRSENLCATEEQILLSILDWVAYDVDERRLFLTRLLKNVRFSCLPATYLSEIMNTHNLLRRERFSVYLMNVAIREQKEEGISRHFQPRNSNIGIICTGGLERILACNDTMCFYPLLSTWYPLAPLQETRYRHCSVVCDNILYVIGGLSEARLGITTVEKYNPATNTWTMVSPIETEVTRFGAATLNGCIYIAGGLSDPRGGPIGYMQKYDPSTNTWHQAAEMFVARHSLSLVSLNSFLYAIGGEDGQNNCYSVCEKYDAESNSWCFISHMNTSRSRSCAAVVDGKIYILGGFCNSIVMNIVECYDPGTGDWIIIKSMSVPRYFAGASAVGSRIYVTGGRSAKGWPVKSIECYNTSNDSWEVVGSMSRPVEFHACSAVVLSGSMISLILNKHNKEINSNET